MFKVHLASHTAVSLLNQKLYNWSHDNFRVAAQCLLRFAKQKKTGHASQFQTILGPQHGKRFEAGGIGKGSGCTDLCHPPSFRPVYSAYSILFVVPTNSYNVTGIVD